MVNWWHRYASRSNITPLANGRNHDIACRHADSALAVFVIIIFEWISIIQNKTYARTQRFMLRGQGPAGPAPARLFMYTVPTPATPGASFLCAVGSPFYFCPSRVRLAARPARPAAPRDTRPRIILSWTVDGWRPAGSFLGRSLFPAPGEQSFSICPRGSSQLTEMESKACERECECPPSTRPRSKFYQVGTPQTITGAH